MKSLVFAALFAVVAGCAGSPESGSQSAAVTNVACEGPRVEPLALVVEPDEGTAPFVTAIQSATVSVDVMVYLLGRGPILDALLERAHAGIHVRVILDQAQRNVNQRYMTQLTDAGAEAVWSDPQFTFMHAKVLVVDDREAMISTGNFDQSHLLRERNFAVVDRDPSDVTTLVRLFDADFAREMPDLSCTRLIVSPVNSRERILDFIGSATTSIEIESMQFADRDVRNAVLARKTAGVTVRAVLADPSWIDANADAATFLAEHGIPVRWTDGVHVKAIVVDGGAAYIGSENMSYTSLTKNREVGVIVTEPENVARIRSTLDADWSTARPFSVGR